METYFIIYRTTCLVSNKFYIGMHKTNNLQDGYLGSGTILKRSVNKHGVENHICEILEYLPDLDSLIKREREIVNEKLISDPSCMNLKIGGLGGGGFWNKEHQLKCQQAGGNATIENVRNIHFKKLKEDSIYKENYSITKSQTQIGDKNPFYGKHHDLETYKPCKKVLQINKTTGEIINQFNSGMEAERITGYHRIHDVCNGKRKSAGGYIWKYLV
jgi:hypothetical protein